MTMTKTHLFRFMFLFALLGLLGATWPFAWLMKNALSEHMGTNVWLENEMHVLQAEASNIDSKVLRLSLLAYANARKHGLSNKNLLTVIDYSKPSTVRRLWVFDLKSGKALFNTWVSHGRNSGGVVASSFSNSPGSLKSSIGVFVTDEPYIGGNGYSLRLKGLEHGINDNAYRRDIVIHGARYVNTDNIRRFGQIGRSWGCPAVSPSLSKSLIDTIKKNTVVFAYYPDRNWLSHSQFLAMK